MQGQGVQTGTSLEDNLALPSKGIFYELANPFLDKNPGWRSVNCGAQTKSDLQFVFVIKFLLENSHVHLLHIARGSRPKPHKALTPWQKTRNNLDVSYGENREIVVIIHTVKYYRAVKTSEQQLQTSVCMNLTNTESENMQHDSACVEFKSIQT